MEREGGRRKGGGRIMRSVEVVNLDHDDRMSA